MPERAVRLGRRVAVLGGGGKTTLARAISRAIGAPHVELDALYWKAGWEHREAEEFKQLVSDTLAGMLQGWVCDGNYLGKLGYLALAQADTVIILNMPWRVMFRRALLRGIGNAWSGRIVCGHNRETWSHLASRESLLLWHIQHRGNYGDRPRRVGELTPAGTRLIQLDTPRQLNQLYQRLGLHRSAASV